MLVLISNKFKKITFLLLTLISSNQTVKATELSLEERYKAAELVESTNISAAFPLYQELANIGFTEAKIRLAALLSAGLGGNTSIEEKLQLSMKLLHEAADEGSIKAYYGLSVMYHDGTSIAPNTDLGMSWLIKAAEGGEPRGQNQLASLYKNGIFVTQDINKAIYWYQKAIENNSNDARYNLANIYLDGLGNSQQKIKEAITLYLAASHQGDVDAKVALGNIYIDNSYGLKNEGKAFDWLNSAAQDGNTFGQTGLASCYRYGIGTEVDYSKALYWYQKSSDLSHSPTARYRLAEMYMLGLGTEVDLNKARDIFLVLSQEGYADGTTAVTQIDQLIAAESQ